MTGRTGRPDRRIISMKDKDKILLLVSIGTYNLHKNEAIERFHEVKEHFEHQFDESYKVVCYPNDSNSRIDIRLYNPDNAVRDTIVQLDEDGSIDALRKI